MVDERAEELVCQLVALRLMSMGRPSALLGLQLWLLVPGVMIGGNYSSGGVCLFSLPFSL